MNESVSEGPKGLEGLDGLAVRNLSKALPGFRLGPISAQFVPGRIHTLLGPNGAGKTTFMNCLALQSRFEGELSLNGQPVGWGDWAFRGQVALVREVPAFYSTLTIAQTMYLASRLYDAWDDRLADDLLRRFALDRSKKVRILSKGTRVRLGLAVGLAHGARVMLLDEPTAGLDPDSRFETQALLQEIRDERRACFLVSSHLFEDVETVADDVRIIRNGRLRYHCTMDSLAGYRTVSLSEDDAAILDRIPVEARWQANGKQWALVRRECEDMIPPATLPSLRVEPATVKDVYTATVHGDDGE